MIKIIAPKIQAIEIDNVFAKYPIIKDPKRPPICKNKDSKESSVDRLSVGMAELKMAACGELDIPLNIKSVQ